jgi:GntR family glv operon transcriptional regulator
VIYKSIADRLRLRLNSPTSISAARCRERKTGEGVRRGANDHPQSIDLLVSWGLVERRHGSGTFVARKDVHHETTNLTGLAEVLRKQGKEVVSKVLVSK